MQLKDRKNIKLLKNMLKSIACFFIISIFVGSSYASDGPVHPDEYYAQICMHILNDKDLSQYHQRNAEDALLYLKSASVSPRTKAALIDCIFLKKTLKEFHLPAASAAVALLTEDLLHTKEKASIALHLFTNRSLKGYYQHEAAIKAWKNFSSDTSIHSSISLAKEVIACNILNYSKFEEHHEHAIVVWKSLDLRTKGFMACDILKNDDLLRHHQYAQNVLQSFFSVDDEIIPRYTKRRLAESIEKNRRLKKYHFIVSTYLDNLDFVAPPTSATTSEEKSTAPSPKKRKTIVVELDQSIDPSHFATKCPVQNKKVQKKKKGKSRTSNRRIRGPANHSDYVSL